MSLLCFIALVGGACGRTWVGAEQCRPDAVAVRGSASMPEAPLGRGGIATNVSSVYEVNFANTKLTMKCKQGI